MKRKFLSLICLPLFVFSFSACNNNQSLSDTGNTCEHYVELEGTCRLCGEEIPNDGVLYRVSQNGEFAEAYGMYDGAKTTINILETYQDLPVTTIAKYAFYEQDTVRNFLLPNTLRYIEKHAFEGCNLDYLMLPSSLTYIGESAFRETDITLVKIPDSVSFIGSGAFQACQKLQTVTVGHGVRYMGYGVFSHCNELTDVTISYGSTTIGEQTFLNCQKLSYIQIPSSVTHIGQGVFSYCTSLTSIVIGGYVKMIEYGFIPSQNFIDIFYLGTAQEWENIYIEKNEEFENATIYYYKADKPTENGNFWHWNQDETPVKW